MSYGLVLTVISDTFFWFAIPGMLGLLTVVLLALHLFLYRPFSGAAPFATDGTDRRGPVKYHYKVLGRRYLLIVVFAVAMVVLPLVLGVRYLNPFIAVGLLALSLGTRFWLPSSAGPGKRPRAEGVRLRVPVTSAEVEPGGQGAAFPDVGKRRLSEDVGT